MGLRRDLSESASRVGRSDPSWVLRLETGWITQNETIQPESHAKTHTYEGLFKCCPLYIICRPIHVAEIHV